MIKKFANLFAKLKIPIDTLLVFIVLAFMLLPDGINACHLLRDINFDSQNHTLWSYSNDLNTVPIKDTYYPHGLLTVYASSNIYIFCLYAIFPALHFTIVYFVLKRLYKNNPLAYSPIFLFVFILTSSLVKTATINRYGMIISGSSLIIYLINKIKSKKIAYLLSGIVMGLVISGSLAIGLLLMISVSTIFIIKFYRILKFNKIYTAFSKIVSVILSLFIGLMIGLIPLFIFLIKNAAWTEFFYYFWKIFEASEFSKSWAIYNRFYIFTVLVIFLQLLAIIKTLATLNSKNDSYYLNLQLISVTSTILIMQKALVRQNLVMVFIFSIFSMSILLYELYKGKFIKRSYIVYSVPLLSILLFSMVFTVSIPSERYVPNLRKTTSILLGRETSTNPLCDLERDGVSEKITDSEYENIVNHINSNYPDAKIFSFSGDPIIYLLLGQKPPPYPNLYDGSSVNAQKENINYIKMNAIELVIYNLASGNHDFVPDILRGSTLLDYILTNFVPSEVIGDFVIFERSEEDIKYFLNDGDVPNKLSNLSSNLLKIDFGNVFRSEGYYKKGKLENISKTLFQGSEQSELNKFLSKSKPSSENLYILIETQEGKNQNKLNITNEFGISTQISYRSCAEYHCLVRLNKLPLFYKESHLLEIDSESLITNVKLLKSENNESFW